MATTSITFRTDEETKKAVDELAEKQRRSRSFIVNEALSAYMMQQALNHKRILDGIAAADRGEFATQEEVDAIFEKWLARCE